MGKRVLMPLAPGFEEIEALSVVDVLRRAGATVVVAATTGSVETPVTGRNSINVVVDTLLETVIDEEFDMVVLPGGSAGTKHLKGDARVARVVKRIFADNGYVTAICAATTVLAALGVINGRRVTCHPGVVAELKGCDYVNERVVVDGTLITSQGPGTAIEFAYALVEVLYGAEKVTEINNGVLARL